MKKVISRYTIFAFVFLFSLPSYASDCDDLHKITLKCLDRRLTDTEQYMIGDCGTFEARKKLIKMVMQDKNFISRLTLIMRLELLQGTTLDNLREELQDFDLIIFTQPDNVEWATSESEKLYKVYHLPTDYADNKISFEDIYVTYFNNWIYDQQNMGIDNYINTTFSYALGRAPTKIEYRSAKYMILEEDANLFYEKGSSKLDYLKILTKNYNFLEKQVKYWHYYFLFEYPDNKEVYAILGDIKRKKGEVTIIDIIEYLITNKL